MTVTANKAQPHFTSFKFKWRIGIEPLYQEVELEALTVAVAQIDKRRIPILTTHFSDQALMIGGSEAADQFRPPSQGRGDSAGRQTVPSWSWSPTGSLSH